MKFSILVGVVFLLAGCLGPPRIVSETPDEIVVQGIPSSVGRAGEVAQTHCASYGKKASYQGQLGVHAHKFICK
jgi:hypothetical protein